MRTMKFSAFTEKEFNAEYKVRAYAVLEDGSYIYSTEISSYSIFNVAKITYDNVLMNTEMNHRYLYDNILKVTDTSYREVEYNQKNSIVNP